MILKAMAYVFCFKASDENGHRSSPDILFDNYRSRGMKFALQEVCGFDPVKDKKLITEFKEYYNTLNINQVY